MAYATTTELADYLYIDEADLPDDAERLLDRASELVDYVTLERIDETDTEEAEAAKKATMAQYEWWAESGDELGVTSSFDSISIGEFSVSNYAGSEGAVKPGGLAPRAAQYLQLAGLLYGGVGIR